MLPVLRKLFPRAMLVAAAASVLTACGGGGDDPIDVTSGTAITNVTVVNTRDGSLSGPLSVVVDGGKITRISHLPVRASGTAQVVDGTGKFVVPGFADMHAHAVETADLNPSYFPLILAYGITGFREQSLSPAIVTRAAKLSPAIGTLVGTNAALKVIDHLGAGLGLVLDCSTDADAIRADLLANGFKPPFPSDYITNPRAYDAALNAQFYQRVIDTYSESKCATLSQAFVTNKTWQALTLIRLRTQDGGGHLAAVLRAAAACHPADGEERRENAGGFGRERCLAHPRHQPAPGIPRNGQCRAHAAAGAAGNHLERR